MVRKYRKYISIKHFSPLLYISPAIFSSLFPLFSPLLLRSPPLLLSSSPLLLSLQSIHTALFRRSGSRDRKRLGPRQTICININCRGSRKYNLRSAHLHHCRKKQASQPPQTGFRLRLRWVGLGSIPVLMLMLIALLILILLAAVLRRRG